VNNGGGGDTGCFEIKIWTNTSKLVNMRITRFRQCRDLVGKSKTFIKDKAKIASRMHGIKTGVVYFSKLLFVTNKEKFYFRSA